MYGSIETAKSSNVIHQNNENTNRINMSNKKVGVTVEVDKNHNQRYLRSSSEVQSILTSCGIGGWRPRALQRFADPVTFLINISLVAVMQSMAGSMVYSMMSTLERRYSFDSTISAAIFIADSVANLIISPIIGYYGVRFNRARLIGFGQMIIALSCVAAAMPYFIYGPAEPFTATIIETDRNNPQSDREQQNYQNHMIGLCINRDSVFSSPLCRDYSNNNTCHDNLINATTTTTTTAERAEKGDSGGSGGGTVWLAVGIFLAANFARGIGFAIYFVIALPFVDDSVDKRRSPLFLSVMHSILLLGPVFGFLLSAACLRWYEDPWNDPGLSRTDARYVGAWWLAFLIVGALVFIAGLPMFLYPAQFRGAKIRAATLRRRMKASGGTREAISRFTGNPLMMLFLASTTFRYLGNGGFFMLLAKYLETQYRISSSAASTLTGSAAVLPLSIGILIGGALIAKYRPTSRQIFIAIFVIEFASTATIGSGILLGCDSIHFDHDPASNLVIPKFELPNSTIDPGTTACNQDCYCSAAKFAPVCDRRSGITYISACHAGCTKFDTQKMTFSSCACLPQPSTTTVQFNNASSINEFPNYENYTTVENGYCELPESERQKCGTNLALYVSLLALGALVSATAKTGNSLITFRAVEPMDKSFTSGVLSACLSMFTFIPAPLLFGRIADSACAIWDSRSTIIGSNDTGSGNCRHYDHDRLRVRYLATSIGFMYAASVFDFLMIFFADRIKNLYEDDEENNAEDDDDSDNRKIEQEKNIVDKHNADNDNDIDDNGRRQIVKEKKLELKI